MNLIQKYLNINTSEFKIKFIGFSLLFIISFYFLLLHNYLPNYPYFDARNYLEIANEINTNGIDSFKNNIRTFLYPWILSIIIKISNIVNIPTGITIYCFQLLFYFATLIIIYNYVKNYSIKLANYIYLGLCLNIFLLPYISLSLTDSVHTTFTILILILLMKLDVRNYSISKVFLLIFLFSMNVVLRPAAIWLIAPVSLYLIINLLSRKIKIFDLFLISFGFIPLLIQIYINVFHFKVFSFFPAIDLGGMQIKWGLENIKFTAWLGGGPVANFYRNSVVLTESLNDFTINWYFNNPIEAVKLLSFKFIGAFDFEFLTPYPYKKPINLWFFSFVSYLILFFGLFSVFYHLLTNKLILLGNRMMPFIILISWSSITLISAVELRFTLPILSYFIFTGIYYIYTIYNSNFKYFLMNLILCISTMPIFYYMAKIVRSAGNINY